MILNLIKDIVIYDNLLDEKSDIHAWEPEQCFPLKNIGTEDKEKLSSIIAIEVIFQGVRNKRELFDYIFSKYDSFVKDFIFRSTIPTYLFKAESSINVKNRIRSYKGVVPNELAKSSYIQVETPIIDDYTLIAALIKLEKYNTDKIFDFFHDRDTSFIISSLNLFTEEYIKLIASNYINHKGSNILNYLKLILNFCPQGDIIYRIGGDGGGDEVSFQFFCQKEKKELMLKQVEAIIASGYKQLTLSL